MLVLPAVKAQTAGSILLSVPTARSTLCPILTVLASIYLSVYLSVHLSVCLSICLSIDRSIYPSIHLSLRLCLPASSPAQVICSKHVSFCCQQGVDEAWWEVGH